MKCHISRVRRADVEHCMTIVASPRLVSHYSVDDFMLSEMNT